MAKHFCLLCTLAEVGKRFQGRKKKEKNEEKEGWFRFRLVLNNSLPLFNVLLVLPAHPLPLIDKGRRGANKSA